MKDEYIVFNAHRIGASHISKGLQCEDYSLSYSDDNVAIAVISDGHGDKNCFRSARGAQLACETAIQATRMICSSEESIKAIKESPDRIICELEKSIIFNWNRSVVQDVKQNPITEEELSNLDANVVEAIRSGTRIQKVYGCTLILNVFLKGFWFGIHVGDGKCVCVLESGLYTQPIPWDDEGCVGNRSTSLCDTRAFKSFRYVYGTDVPVAIFVGSDGVDESFDDNGINKCYYSLACWVKTLSSDECKMRADELLEKISHGGSGDDVSISCIVSRTKEIKKPISTSKQVADKMQEMYELLTSTEANCLELLSKTDELNASIDIANDEIRRLETELENKKASLANKTAERDNVEKNLKSIREQLAPMIKQFEDAKPIKIQVDEYWSRLGVEPYDNNTVMNYVPSDIMRIKESEPVAEQPVEEAPVAEQPVAEEPVIEYEESSVPAADVSVQETAAVAEEPIPEAKMPEEKSIEAVIQPGIHEQSNEDELPSKPERPNNGGLFKNLFGKK